MIIQPCRYLKLYVQLQVIIHTPVVYTNRIENLFFLNFTATVVFPGHSGKQRKAGVSKWKND